MHLQFSSYRLACGLVSLVVLFTGCESHSTSTPVPPSVEQALHTKFRGPLEKLVWQPAPQGWVASFHWKTIPVRSQVTGSGQILETELGLEEVDVPVGLQMALQQRYPHYQVQKKSYVERGNQRFYRLQLASPDGNTRLYSFQRDGQLLPAASH